MNKYIVILNGNEIGGLRAVTSLAAILLARKVFNSINISVRGV